MRYQPLNATRKNEYVGENWTPKKLANMMRYYSSLNFMGHIPFGEYTYPGQKPQLEMSMRND
jgi:hypothetical protein